MSSLQSSLGSHRFVSAVTRMLQLALPDQLVPHGFRILVGWRDGHDARPAASGHWSVADSGLVVEPGQLEAFLEGFQRPLQFLFGERLGRRYFLRFSHPTILVALVRAVHPINATLAFCLANGDASEVCVLPWGYGV